MLPYYPHRDYCCLARLASTVRRNTAVAIGMLLTVILRRGLYRLVCYVLWLITHICTSSHPPITVAARFEAWTVFVRSNIGMVGSIPTQGMDVCVRLFCVYVVLCVGSGLVTGWSPVQVALPNVYRIKKLKKAAKVQRALEPQRENKILIQCDIPLQLIKRLEDNQSDSRLITETCASLYS
jgi:hypothetical protein